MFSSISPNNELTNGIIVYLINRFDYLPLFKANSNTKVVDPIKMYTEDVYLDYDLDKENPTLEIDFKSFSISISEYIIEFIEDTTPPVEWQILGKNKINENWKIIHESGLIIDVCPFTSTTNVRCLENYTKKWNFPTPLEPFRYIKFINMKQRENENSGIQKGYMRLGKIDFYGSIWFNSRTICLRGFFPTLKFFLHLILITILC